MKRRDLIKGVGAGIVLSQIPSIVSAEQLQKNLPEVKLFWSRRPGEFVVRETGVRLSSLYPPPPPKFTGDTAEWYETLIETLHDLKVRLKSDSNFILTSEEVVRMLRMTSLYHFKGGYSNNKIGFQGTTNIGVDVYAFDELPVNQILMGTDSDSVYKDSVFESSYGIIEILDFWDKKTNESV